MSYTDVVTSARQIIGSTVPKTAKDRVPDNAAIGAGGLKISQTMNSSQADHPTLSNLAGLLSRTSANVDDRAGIISTLQETIESGKYKVSASDVAENLMRTMVR